MSQDDLPIGEAARLSGVKAPTIRYYEDIGLLPPPPRTLGNRRAFDAARLRRLSFIRHARELGFEIDAIRALLKLQDHPASPASQPTRSPAPGWPKLTDASRVCPR